MIGTKGLTLSRGPKCHVVLWDSRVGFKGLGLRTWGGYMSHSLNSLKGGYIGDYIGDYYRVY